MKEHHSARTPGSLSLWSLSSSFVQKQNERQQEDKRSFLWSSSLYTKMAVYSLAVTSSSIFRFPEAVYKYGGAFIAAYALVMLVVVQPLVYLELLLGQLYIRKLPVRSARSIFKAFARGLSVTTVVVILLYLPNHSIVNLQSSSFVDIGSSPPSSNFEWCSCDFLGWSSNEKSSFKYTENMYLAFYNSSNCLGQNDYTKLEELKMLNRNPVFALDESSHGQFSTVLYFKQEILNRRREELQRKEGQVSGSHDYIWSYIQWKLILSGFLSSACILLFSCEWKFQNLVSKMLLWLTLAFPMALVGLLAFQLDVSGRVFISMRLLLFDWEKLSNINLWFEAVRLAILTSSVGFGLHTSISSSVRMSYRKFYQVSWMFIFFVMATAFISTLLLFSEIEILTTLMGTQNPRAAVDTIPNYSIGLFASIFCKRDYFISLQIFYWIFYLLRIVATSRIHVLAVETILRALAFNDTTSRRKLSRLLLKLAIIAFMQLGMAIPYMLKGSEEVIGSFYLFSGMWPISILLVCHAFYFSTFDTVTMLEEDLYLSYRIRFPKMFAFQQKTFLAFAGILASALLLSSEIVLNLVSFARGKTSLTLCDWPTLYGVTLNAIPFAVFLACLCYEFGLKSRFRQQPQKTSKPNSDSCSLLLNPGRPSSAITLTRSPKNRMKSKREKEKPYYPWQEELKKSSFNSFYDSHSQITRATIDSSRLRRPSVDNLGNAFAGNPNGNLNLDPARKLSVPLCDCPEASKGNGCPHTIMDYPEGTEEFPYVSTFRGWKDGRRRKRHRVIRPIRRRRAPLPPEWSPGGLGDFSLYNAHLNGRPPGPDARRLTTTTATQAEWIPNNNNSNINTSHNNNHHHHNRNKDGHCISIDIPPPPPPSPSPPSFPPSIIDNNPSDNNNPCEDTSSFPPPPKFLLELGVGSDVVQDYSITFSNNMDGDSVSSVGNLQRLEEESDSKMQSIQEENLKEEDVQDLQDREILTAIDELDEVLANKKTTLSVTAKNLHGDNNDHENDHNNNNHHHPHGDNSSVLSQITFQDETINTAHINTNSHHNHNNNSDLKSDDVSINSASTSETANVSFGQLSQNDNMDDGSSACHSFLFADKNQL